MRPSIHLVRQLNGASFNHIPVVAIWAGTAVEDREA
jgi:hypothetical protein